jgi:DNA-binding NarL/FixJ family response regulator
MMPRMIRALVVDDHQAVRAGLVALLRQEPGFVPVATAGTAADALALAEKEAVDVAVVDYHLPDASGVELCRGLPDGVEAVLYTAVPLEGLTIPALVAGARGVVSKAAPAEELFEAIRAVIRGRSAHPPIDAHSLGAAGDRLMEEDLPIIGMAVDHTTPAEMADALRISRAELGKRIDRVIARLQPSNGAGRPGG